MNSLIMCTAVDIEYLQRTSRKSRWWAPFRPISGSI